MRTIAKRPPRAWVVGIGVLVVLGVIGLMALLLSARSVDLEFGDVTIAVTPSEEPVSLPVLPVEAATIMLAPERGSIESGVAPPAPADHLYRNSPSG